MRDKDMTVFYQATFWINEYMEADIHLLWDDESGGYMASAMVYMAEDSFHKYEPLVNDNSTNLFTVFIQWVQEVQSVNGEDTLVEMGYVKEG